MVEPITFCTQFTKISGTTLFQLKIPGTTLYKNFHNNKSNQVFLQQCKINAIIYKFFWEFFSNIKFFLVKNSRISTQEIHNTFQNFPQEISSFWNYGKPDLPKMRYVGSPIKAQLQTIQSNSFCSLVFGLGLQTHPPLIP